MFSSISILGGIVPVILKHRVKGWLYWHYQFINWSVVGLYAAFWAETLTRLMPMQQFWPVVIGATVATTILGGRLIRRSQHQYFGTDVPERSVETVAVRWLLSQQTDTPYLSSLVSSVDPIF